MEVHIDLGNVSQIVNENEIRARVRNIRRFLTMTEARLNRLHVKFVFMYYSIFAQFGSIKVVLGFNLKKKKEIQSGAPLDDSSNSTIIVGSIQTTTSLTDGTNVIDLQTNQQNFMNPLSSSMAAFAANMSRNATGPAHSQIVPSQATTAASPTPEGTSTNQTTETAATSSSAPQPAADQPTPPQQNINIAVLADLIQNVMSAYTRFTPFLQQYHDMLVNDANEPPSSPSRPPTADGAFNFGAAASAPAAAACSSTTTTTSTSSTTTTTTTTTTTADGNTRYFFFFFIEASTSKSFK
jgi:hypothetical protein